MLNWLYKILGAVPPEERDGIALEEPTCWKVPTRLAFSDFARTLPKLAPEGSILYLEDGEHPRPLRVFLEARQVPPQSKVRRGTTWPRAKIYHLPTDAAFLAELAEITDRCANPEVCDHLCVYKDGVALIQSYDCLWDAVYISQKMPVESVKMFCEQLGCSYEETHELA